MKAYLGTVSGNSYKLRILLSLLKVPHEVVIIDLKNKQHKGAAFLQINPRGEVPALEDEGKVIWDSAACLVYVARKYGGEQWLPSDAAGMADVMQWIALAATEIQCGLQYARRGAAWFKAAGRWARWKKARILAASRWISASSICKNTIGWRWGVPPLPSPRVFPTLKPRRKRRLRWSRIRRLSSGWSVAGNCRGG